MKMPIVLEGSGWRPSVLKYSSIASIVICMLRDINQRNSRICPSRMLILDTEKAPGLQDNRELFSECGDPPDMQNFSGSPIFSDSILYIFFS